MKSLYLYVYIWVTIFVSFYAGPVPQRQRRISYGLKLQNKPRINAIKTTPITTTTTTTTMEAIRVQNTSYQSIHDYLNYDYDYLHYFYDYNYDDATVVEKKNKQRKENVRSEPLKIKDEIHNIPQSFKEEISSEPLSILDKIDSQIENEKDQTLTIDSGIIKDKVLNEPSKFIPLNKDLPKEIKFKRTNIDSDEGGPLLGTKETFPVEEKFLLERKTLPEEVIPIFNGRNSAPEKVKSLEDDGKTFHKEKSLIDRQEDLLETEIEVSEENNVLQEGEHRKPVLEERKNFLEKKRLSINDSDILSHLKLNISNEELVVSKAIKIENGNKNIQKINVIIRKPTLTAEPKKVELNGVNTRNQASFQGREGRLLDHDTSLQKMKTISKETDGLNPKNETVLEAVSKGIKQLRYTTQQPDVAKSDFKSSIPKIKSKQTNSSDLVEVSSSKTSSVDEPIVEQNFEDNDRKLGWRSESSVSVEVSVESSQARGKEISSLPNHKRIVNISERAQESMQLKEQLSLEVSATPKITDILPTIKKITEETKPTKKVLIALEHKNDSEIITTKNLLKNTTMENNLLTTSSTSTFHTNLLEATTSISPTVVNAHHGSKFSAPKNSSKHRKSFYTFESFHTSTSQPTSTTPKITTVSDDNLNNEHKAMKHSTIEQTDSTRATTISETSSTKKFFIAEELPTTSPRHNVLPKNRQSRPFRRNQTLHSRMPVPPNENLVPPHLISQLGMNPHGIHPSGINPFGMQPQGITPFGVSPKGIDPLGSRLQVLNVNNNNSMHVKHPNTTMTNETNTELTRQNTTKANETNTELKYQNITMTNETNSELKHQNTTMTNEKNTELKVQNTTMINETNTELKLDPVAEERVHVQVTKPDGSINGDYLVLDHNTGSLSGVRYEAIDGADQALIQKALLSFLSLDPRLDPRPKDINGENLPETFNNEKISPIMPDEALHSISDPAINTKSTTSVKLKPQVTDQT